jgi:hypothetical protein
MKYDLFLTVCFPRILQLRWNMTGLPHRDYGLRVLVGHLRRLYCLCFILLRTYFWEPDSLSAGQKLSPFYRIRKFVTVCKPALPPLDYVISQLNPFHLFTPFLFKYHLLLLLLLLLFYDLRLWPSLCFCSPVIRSNFHTVYFKLGVHIAYSVYHILIKS